ncbi:MAG: hypothetical protein HY821_00510 [Acidobacteria bacterium]|nr:hypothetical protein [Acidobacteriota bacterium]
MFPWVYGFQWSFGYVLFLGIFFAVAAVVVSTLILAAWRSFSAFRRGRVPLIQWDSAFHDLPPQERACRHDFTGELSGRVCERGFDCRECATHAKLLQVHPPEPAPDLIEVSGLAIPTDRLYHRGHTWAQLQPDGSYLIGLDLIGRRLAGANPTFTLPTPGTPIIANSPALSLHRPGAEARILAPIDGIVLETAPPNSNWLLRLKPSPFLSTRHLLSGSELRAWFARELDRLQLALSAGEGAPSLADGGVLVDDLAAGCTPAQLDTLCGAIFLDE